MVSTEWVKARMWASPLPAWMSAQLRRPGQRLEADDGRPAVLHHPLGAPAEGSGSSWLKNFMIVQAPNIFTVRW